LSRSLKDTNLGIIIDRKEVGVKITRTTMLMVVALLLLGAGGATAGGFMKMGDIKGESTDPAHQDWSDVLAWAWRMERSQGAGVGSGRGASRVEFGDLLVTKHVDSASPMLMLKCADGSHIREAVLDVPLDGGRGAMIRIILFNVQVTSVHVVETGDDAQPSENLSLNFTEVKVVYESDGGAIEFNWNIESNRAP
jgi:type VI secretion system secreted protein Hcp